MRHQTTAITPCPSKLGGLFLKKKIGFSFDKLGGFLMMEQMGVEDGDIKEWTKKNGENQLIVEQFYGAHLSYCHWQRKKPLERERFFLAVSRMSEKTQKQIMRAAEHASYYGRKRPLNSKKKVAR